MVVLDEKALAEILVRYQKRLPEIRANEIYKWEAVKCFRDNWNPEADDFAGMLTQCLSGTAGLLDSGNYFPKGMLTEFASRFPQKTRDALIALLDGPEDLVSRMKDFEEASDGLLKLTNDKRASSGEKIAKSSYQDPRAMNVYLTFAHPEAYYLYKCTMYEEAAKRLGVYAGGNKFQMVLDYADLCETIFAYVEKRVPELIKESDSLLSPELRDADPAYHLLMQDIIFYAGAYEEGEPGSHWVTDKKELKAREKPFLNWAVTHPREENGEPYAKSTIVNNDMPTIRNAGKWYRQLLEEPIPDNLFSIEDAGLVSKLYERVIASGEYNDSDDYRGIALYRDYLIEKSNSQSAPSYWIYAPGANACKWDECVSQGIMVLGWDEIGDFAQYETRDAMIPVMDEAYGAGTHMNDTLACWDFQHTIKPGDFIYAKRGLSKIIGRGIVKSDARFEEDRGDFTHVRDVEWTEVGERDFKPLPMKTLTNWTSSEWTEKLEALFAKPSEKVSPEIDPYTDEDFLSEVYVSTEKLASMKSLLRRKKNIILQGSPGTGKTFAAKRLAYAMMGERADARVKMVQFHQSSTYDDFVIGYRPTDSGSFAISEGTFTRFCDRALDDPAHEYYLVIDEINRANISKVFGELLMLIEADHRGESVELPVGNRSLTVPENLYIIGMMNTADRGLALIDYALRRRFGFIEMEPAFGNATFQAALEARGDAKLLVLAEAVQKLNEDIAKEPSLGSGFTIGHSYFCTSDDSEQLAESIVEFELAPLIREYWFDDAQRATTEIAKLQAAIQ